MKHAKLFAVVAALGFFGFGAPKAQALEKLIFDVKLTSQSQGDPSTNGNSQKLNVDKTKIATQDLLTLIANFYNTNFPSGAELVLVDYTGFVVYSSDPNKGGSVLQIVASDVLSYEESAVVTQENTNTKSGAFSGTRNYIITLHFNDGHTVVELSGYATHTFSGNNTSLKYNSSIKANVSGSGLNDVDGVLIETGSISAKGSGTSN